MKKFIALAAALALVASTAAQAQTCTTASCTVTNTVSATAPTVLNLTLTSITTTLTNPTATDFDVAAGIDNAGPGVTLKSNKNASVTISTAAANWTYVGAGSATKSIGDLRWRTSGGGPGTALSGTAGTVIASGKGTRSATITWNTFWALATDEPGDYSLATTFTLVAP